MRYLRANMWKRCEILLLGCTAVRFFMLALQHASCRLRTHPLPHGEIRLPGQCDTRLGLAGCDYGAFSNRLAVYISEKRIWLLVSASTCEVLLVCLLLIVQTQKWGFSCKVQKRPPADIFLNESLPPKPPCGHHVHGRHGLGSPKKIIEDFQSSVKSIRYFNPHIKSLVLAGKWGWRAHFVLVRKFI
jgi:hypothetical protein